MEEPEKRMKRLLLFILGVFCAFFGGSFVGWLYNSGHLATAAILAVIAVPLSICAVYKSGILPRHKRVSH